MAEGAWTVKMKAANAQDAFLLVSSFDDAEKVELEMAGMGKVGDTSFTLKAPRKDGITSFSVKLKDPEGNEVKHMILPKLGNKAEFTSKLPNVLKPGVYNMTDLVNE